MVFNYLIYTRRYCLYCKEVCPFLALLQTIPSFILAFTINPFIKYYILFNRFDNKEICRKRKQMQKIIAKQGNLRFNISKIRVDEKKE